MSTRSKMCEFSKTERQAIIDRDKTCLFCRMGYAPSKEQGFFHSIAHYVPRSKGGLGIRQNGVLLCQYHHGLMDNGNTGARLEMLGIVKEYLEEHYGTLDESKLMYNKWDFLN